MTDIRKALNVFAQSVVAGQVAEISAAGPASQTVMVLQTSLNTILPGYPVKLVAGDGSVPLVDLAVPGTDDIYGLALFNPKVSSWAAKDLFQVSTLGAVVYLTAEGTLSRGDQVGLDTSTYKIQAATLANYIGTVLDEASADDVVRVQLAIPLGVSKASA